jgi:hypothetical protein
MASEEREIIQRVLEQYVRTGSATDEAVKVTCLPVGKTSYVERIGEDGRTLLLDEYRLDGQVIWASYSPRTSTVYLSMKSVPQKIS